MQKKKVKLVLDPDWFADGPSIQQVRYWLFDFLFVFLVVACYYLDCLDTWQA